MSNPDWTTRFDGLLSIEPLTAQYLETHSKVISIPSKTTIFGPGKSPENMLLLLDGTVRVQQSSENGHEIVLYRINAVESCVLTTACLLSHEAYSAEGITETNVSAVTIPRDSFNTLVSTSAVFRDFVFSAFSKRITELFMMIDEVAFQRIDVRLAQKLITLADAQGTITTTHQKLSVELGTAREVISRQLQEFNRRGWIDQSRSKIAILDFDEITHLSKTAR
jgi:CRP/FNR family transcriptional regulator